MSFSAVQPTNSPEPYRPPPYDEATRKALIDAAPDRVPSAGPPPVRSTRKAEAWTGALYRAHAYVSARLHPGDRPELDALLERTVQAGPDFLKVRWNATFAPVPIVAYSREVAVEIMRQAREIERETYASRAKGAHGGALGVSALRLLEWFVFTLWPRAIYGMVPSIAFIASADGARMSRPTVVEGMKRLEAFGFLTITRRRKRVPTALGIKQVQDTNAYVLGLAKGLGALALAAFSKKPKESAAERRARVSELGQLPAIKSDHYSSIGRWKTRDPKHGLVPLLT
jgi:hypothetical protein